jgi:DegV family protein with EDD domain
MKLGLVTDSTSDLPDFLVEQYGLEVVPSILILEGKEFADGTGMSRQEFYKQLPFLGTGVSTAAPSIGEFTSRYEKLISAGCDQILSIHAPGQLTTIINSAKQAANPYGERVTVMDSGSLSLGLGFQVLAAAEAAEEGMDAALEAIRSTRERTFVAAALDTMEYLRRSGRVPAAVTMVGDLLNIKPLVELKDGELKRSGAVRTTEQANQLMLKSLVERGKMQRLAILHSGAEVRARQFLDQLMQSNHLSVPRDVLIVNVTPVIGAHVGPNGLGFAAVME